MGEVFCFCPIHDVHFYCIKSTKHPELTIPQKVFLITNEG